MSNNVDWINYQRSPIAYVTHAVQIYNATAAAWLPFRLWPQQQEILQRMHDDRLLVVLKARQLGLSWLALAYALWVMTFRSPATILLFSLRAAEAEELLTRLRHMHHHLPAWLQARHIIQSNPNAWTLSTGSRALAFSTKAGRSYTGTLAIVDEADYIPDLGTFLNGVKPTIDAGGKLFLISTSDKKQPASTFKNLYRAAQDQIGDYHHAFLPWYAHPARDRQWHDRTKREMYAQRGTDDDFYAEYPATPEEALAPETLDRRFPWPWLKTVYHPQPEVILTSAPAIPSMITWQPPAPNRSYIIGADPAEGNPNSDESAATVLDTASWEQVAVLAGAQETHTFAHNLAALSAYYNDAGVMVERNNHGHAVLLKLSETHAPILTGFDDKPGWLTNVKGKPLLLDLAAEAVRDAAVTLHDERTVNQLSTIESSTLRAAGGLHDDRALAFCLAIAAIRYHELNPQPATILTPADALAGIDQRKWTQWP